MDKTSKIIFALIAAGLWFNAAANLLRPAYAQQNVDANAIALADIKVSAESIASSLITLVRVPATAPTNSYVLDEGSYRTVAKRSLVILGAD